MAAAGTVNTVEFLAWQAFLFLQEVVMDGEDDEPNHQEASNGKIGNDWIKMDTYQFHLYI